MVLRAGRRGKWGGAALSGCFDEATGSGAEAKAAERARLYGDVGMAEPSKLGSTGVVMVEMMEPSKLGSTE